MFHFGSDYHFLISVKLVAGGGSCIILCFRVEKCKKKLCIYLTIKKIHTNKQNKQAYVSKHLGGKATLNITVQFEHKCANQL